MPDRPASTVDRAPSRFVEAGNAVPLGDVVAAILHQDLDLGHARFPALVTEAPDDSEALVLFLDDASERLRFTLGRDPGNEVVVNDGLVSKHHAAILKRATGWWLIDLGSTNGTALDGVPIDAWEPVALVAPATIRIGTRAKVHFLDRASFESHLTALSPRTGEKIATGSLATRILERVKSARRDEGRFLVTLEGALVEEFEDEDDLVELIRARPRDILEIRIATGARGPAEVIYKRTPSEIRPALRP